MAPLILVECDKLGVSYKPEDFNLRVFDKLWDFNLLCFNFERALSLPRLSQYRLSRFWLEVRSAT